MGDRRPQREPGAAADTLHSSGRHTTSPPDRPGQVRPGSRGCRGTPSWTSLVSTPGQGQGTKVPTPQPRFYAHSDHEVKEPEFKGDGASNPHHGPPISLWRCRLCFQSLNYKGRECQGSSHFGHNISQELRVMQGKL